MICLSGPRLHRIRPWCLPILIACFLVAGCQSPSGSDPDKESGDYRSIRMDLFTLATNAQRARSGVRIDLTEAGSRLYRADAPEAAFPIDSLRVTIPLEDKPTAWEAYLCVEKMIWLVEQPGPDDLAVMQQSGSAPVGFTRYLAFEEGERGTTCMPWDGVHAVDQGLRVRVYGFATGTLTLYYR